MGPTRSSANLAINKLLVRVRLRAESSSPDILRRTFVEIPAIANSLQRFDHQVIYGRRGSGKTHAFRNLADTVSHDGDLPIFIDLRRIGSNSGLYADSGQPLTLRATQLLIDVVEVVHSELLIRAIEDEAFEEILPHLDDLAAAATEVKVEGSVLHESEAEVSDSEATTNQKILSAGWSRGPTLAAKVDGGRKKESKRRVRARAQHSGSELPRILFGRLSKAFQSISTSIAPRRIWILLDEWSSIPMELQSILADMLRRTVLVSPGFTVKIGAIERRSRFILRGDTATYVGLELGSDTAATLNLDENLIALESGPNARRFFAELLSNHISVLAQDLGTQLDFDDPIAVIKLMFERNAFDEYVRAAEGVPRDALNIAGIAASLAGPARISIAHVQLAATKFYLLDKEIGIAGNPQAQNLWTRLQKEVLVARRSRTFLLRRNRDHAHPAIMDLYDARLIHLLQAGIVTPGEPGVGFDGYSIDYGCYIRAMNRENDELDWAELRRDPQRVFSVGRATLPDNFDQGIIFSPTRTRSGRGRSSLDYDHFI